MQNMPRTKSIAREEKIHLAFETSLFLKGLFALGEIIGAIIAFFATKEFLLKTASVLTQAELAVWLLVITGVDVIVIALTWHAYKFLRRLSPTAS